MSAAAGEGPYRAPVVVDAPFAPSLRFVTWIAAVFGVPASLYLLASVWSLFTAPDCGHEANLGGEALLLLVLGVASGAFSVLGMRRAGEAIRDRVRVRSWFGKTAWTTIAASPVVLASLGMIVTTLYFDLHYLFLRCLDLGGAFSFH
jgi:hypothetical protein